MNSYKNIAELFLSINQLNKQKWNVLQKMLELEYQDKLDSKEYIEYIQIYELICTIQNKNIAVLTEKDKQEIRNLIRSFNLELANQNFFDLFQIEYKTLILGRTSVDLDSPLLSLYDSSTPNLIQHALLQILGIEIQEENLIDKDQVNDYMMSDFTNMLYHMMQNTCDLDTTTIEERRQLIAWKYRLIFLSPSLENRTLETKFSIPAYPRLVNDITVETTGIQMREYLDSLDESISYMIRYVIGHIFLEIENHSLTNSLKLFYMLILKSLVALANNKKIYQDFQLRNQLDDSEEIKTIVNTINDILASATQEESNYQKQRKYFSISV